MPYHASSHATQEQSRLEWCLRAFLDSAAHSLSRHLRAHTKGTPSWSAQRSTAIRASTIYLQTLLWRSMWRSLCVAMAPRAECRLTRRFCALSGAPMTAWMTGTPGFVAVYQHYDVDARNLITTSTRFDAVDNLRSVPSAEGQQPTAQRSIGSDGSDSPSARI
jgi:hypothetical protein